ncbi:MAG: type II toxin-antitoxin system RatA family toxin [Sulfitobacter sp.]
MPSHSEIKPLPYSAQQMYDLVADIGSYPQFLPWTAAARILRREDRDDHEVVDADLIISFKVFREKFTSRVVLWPGEKRINTEYLDGPFKHMISNWRFEEAESGCLVHFDVDFEFRNVILQKVIGVVFNEAMQRIVRAFEKRAQALYG